MFFSFEASAQYEIILDGTVKSVEKDSLLAAAQANKISNQLISEGYLNYTLEKSDEAYTFSSGPQYTFGDIKMDENVKNILAASGYKDYLLKNAPTSKKTISKLTNQALSYLQNQGYINARLSLKDTKIIDQKVNTTLHINKGNQIVNDSIMVLNGNKISRSFLHRYLDIPFKKPFDARKFKNIRQKINNLPYLRMDTDPDINLVYERAEVVLNMQDVKASRFDFIIGILPQTSSGNTKYKVIGEFTTEMNNFFGYGESFYAHIQRLQSDNQELDLRASYPYLFNTPLVTEGSFKLYKNGGDFIELKADVGVNYALNDFTTIGGFIDYRSSRLIDIDSTQLLRTKKLPEQLDLSLTGFSVNITSQNLDYQFNPSKGYRISLHTPFSRKKIIRNRSIEALSNQNIDFVQGYDTLNLNTFQLRPQLDIDYYLPLSSRFILKVGSKNGYIFNNYKVYENEYFRLGGHGLLRGFDELSITTQAFSVWQAEVRLKINETSFISLPFVDSGWIHRPDEPWEHALGLGMGMNFGTPVGMFNVSFAAGKRRDLPFNFNNIKVHFGYVSLF